MTILEAEAQLAQLESVRAQALEIEQGATMLRETCDKQIQVAKRLIRDLKREPLPVAKRPGDWTESE